MSNWKNFISKNVYESDDKGLNISDMPVATQTPDQVSLVIGEIDLKQSGNVVLYHSLATAKYFMCTKLDFIAKDISPMTILDVPTITPPLLNIGFTGSDYKEIAENYRPDLKQNLMFAGGLVNGQTPLMPPDTDLIMKIKSVAVGTNYKVLIRMLGYYISL